MDRTNKTVETTTKTKKNETTNEGGVSETKKAVPIKLAFLESDAVGFCDVETGVCAVPAPADPAGPADTADTPAASGDASHPADAAGASTDQRKPAADGRAPDRKQRS